MEKYFKVSESELLELLKAAATMLAYEGGGVDNWCGIEDAVTEYLNETMKQEGLDPGAEENEDFSFSDIAKIWIEGYEEVK